MAQATERQVRMVNVPRDIVETRTFKPVPHRVILDTVYNVLDTAGLKVAVDENGQPKKTFTLLDDNAKMFALIVLESSIMPGVNLMVGIINSFNRTLAAKIAWGCHVGVCSNGSIFGEKVIGRKHTTYIMDELPEKVEAALALSETYSQQQRKFFDRLRDVELSDAEAHDLIVRSARKPYEAITGGEIVHVAEQWHNPRFPDFQPRTAYSLHNAFTDVYMRGGGNKATGVANRNGIEFTERSVRLSKLFVEQYAHDLQLAGATSDNGD